jgi:hypothetical protein
MAVDRYQVEYLRNPATTTSPLTEKVPIRFGEVKTGKPLERGLRNIIRTKSVSLRKSITSTAVILICQGRDRQFANPF